MILPDSYLCSKNPDFQFYPHNSKSAAKGRYNQFTLSSMYQPIVSFTHQRIVGYEALVRTSEAPENFSPDALFELAGALGESPELDRLCRAIHISNFKQTEDPSWLFLNIDSQMINSPTLSIDFVNKTLHRHGLSPSQIVLEIVENKVQDDEKLNAFVKHYKSLGFRIAIDDFGKGESNFDRIWRVAPHIVKLDRSMLIHAEQNNKARGVLKGLVGLLRQSGCLVLIQGVETEKHVEIALDAEADMLQGFYFAKPAASLATNKRMVPVLNNAMRRYRQTQFLKEEQSHLALRALRLEILIACDELARGQLLDKASKTLLSLLPVKRCFILDKTGTQIGKSATFTKNKDHKVTSNNVFNPLIDAAGASWAHREYFQSAMSQPDHICISKSYIALPDAESTITFSIHTYTEQGHVIFCVDTSPEELNQDITNLPSVIGLN